MLGDLLQVLQSVHCCVCDLFWLIRDSSTKNVTNE